MNWDIILLMAAEAKKGELSANTQIKSISNALNKNHETLMDQATKISGLKNEMTVLVNAHQKLAQERDNLKLELDSYAEPDPPLDADFKREKLVS